jgi:two-component system chemotaxis response regulator CheB
VDALSRILPNLPAGYALPVMIVVHMAPDKRSTMAELFRRTCRLEVKEAEDKEPIQNGHIYFAPPNYHLLVEPDRSLALSDDEPVLFCRPAIDVLFQSAADVYGRRLVGVVLTGANADGARGLEAVCAAGGVGLVENPEEAHIATMPREASKGCPHARVLSLDEIARFLAGLNQPGDPAAAGVGARSR